MNLKKIMSEAKKPVGCEKNPMFRQNHTEETKTIMSDAKKGENNSMFGQNHSDETKKKMSEAKQGQQIEVTDIKNNTTTSYNSIHEAARAL